MESIYDNRCKNLNKVKKEFNTNRDMAAKFNTTEQSIGQLLNGNRKIGNAFARRVESEMGLPTNSFDQRNIDVPSEIEEISKKIAELIVELDVPPEKIITIIKTIYASSEK
ncbi:XRE family transcriptional regulator [Photobacterium frigidiphilum]|uniref:XRE family transcriptional regulator n=1 Tax=Photobacterium frigidiphilum TaxID=264736 RepID=UPI003D0C534F